VKTFERIFLYSILAILFFYVFLVDGKVESKVAIQEEIVARHVTIMNDAGGPVVVLSAYENGNRGVGVFNKSGKAIGSLP
jgi:hypothetical protein